MNCSLFSSQSRDREDGVDRVKLLFPVLTAWFEVWGTSSKILSATTLNVFVVVVEEEICVDCGGDDAEEPEECERFGGRCDAKDDPSGCGEEGEVGR